MTNPPHEMAKRIRAIHSNTVIWIATIQISRQIHLPNLCWFFVSCRNKTLASLMGCNENLGTFLKLVEKQENSVPGGGKQPCPNYSFPASSAPEQQEVIRIMKKPRINIVDFRGGKSCSQSRLTIQGRRVVRKISAKSNSRCSHVTHRRKKVDVKRPVPTRQYGSRKTHVISAWANLPNFQRGTIGVKG